MSRSRTVSFRGAAAAAFVNAQMGVKADTEDDKLARVVTFIYGYVKSGDMAGAKALVLIVAREGLDKACAAVTS